MIGKISWSRSLWWCVAGSGFLCLALVGAAVGYVSFDSFSVPSLDRIRQVSAAVVFTGQFERVDVGLRLADAGTVPRLYISGVNGNAGLDPNPVHFVEQFSIRNPEIADLRRLVACCVEWGERADNTFQNAQDTKCWVDRRGLTGPLLLITSWRTLARATAALSGALPDRVIVPYPVEDGPPEVGRNRMREYLKYLATIVAARLPLIVGGQPVYGPFAEDCPKTL
jgi:uncharacterized SAM-binding protein YcdF (DUF218 family)